MKVGCMNVYLPSISQLLERAIEGRHLLDHPFYRRWENGELEEGELAGYASQYRYFEAHLPVALTGIAELLPSGRARELVLANLSDEIEGPISHLELFSGFERAVGATGEEPGVAVTGLIRAYDDAITQGAASGLGAIAAYEIQASAVAITKSEGLREHYRVDEGGRTFWDVHGQLEVDHAQWTTEALSEFGDRETIFVSARASADAWWAFLDEREEFARSL